MDFLETIITHEETLTDWINTVALSVTPSEKLEYFLKIQELLIHRSPNLLNKYLPEVLNFTTDRNPDIKKALVGFIEELCKLREALLPKVMLNLHLLLCDESIPVQKRVIQATISIYRRTLAWLCKATNITEEMEEAWKQLSTIKLEIANMIDSDNDGIRTSSVKFLECVVLLQTYPDETENKRANDFSLDDVPLTLKIARRRKLEEEASNLFELLVKFHGSPHISSANLLACIGVLTNIAKSRAEFMVRVVDAIESLYNNLPPTLTTTQVNSVRKKLKTELAGLIKHPAAFEFVDKISPMLLELGSTPSDIAKLIPKSDDRRKYNKRTLSSESPIQAFKKPRIDTNYDYDDNDDLPSTPFEANEQFILENLTLEKAVYLIITSIPKLPQVMPPHFTSEYSKCVKSGQIGKLYLAGIMAQQFIDNSVGPGANMPTAIIPKPTILPDKEVASKKRERELDETSIKDEKAPKKERLTKMPKIKSLKLSEITKPLDKALKERLLISSVKRLLVNDAQTNLQQKIVTTVAACFAPMVTETVMNFLMGDLKLHIDTALSWLFEEYSIMQGFSRMPALRKEARLNQSYNKLLCNFIKATADDSAILARMLLESPLLTDDAMELIREICRDERRSSWALGLLRDLALRKPPKQLTFLNALLNFTTYENNLIRESAIEHVLALHEKRLEMKLVIEEFARMNLEFLKLQRPPESLCGLNQGRLKSETWGDDYIKACLLPYISLLPANESLIHDLSKVYVQTSPDIKRIILRLVDPPIRAMGMESRELLKLVEECPKGSETLVIRVIHTLTDKGAPSYQLVHIVRELYNTKVFDVRFLIPVLNGLTKKEIITALPKLIKLNPVVVREVFNRVLGIHGESPISPTELLVALHVIDQSKVDLKTIMKATSMCLQEKQIFTQEVLAVVLQQLMDLTPMPTLLMRTVIQALGSYPKLSGFVMNILQRLILKQVWKQKVVWDGFIKCCQRTKPQSFAVLLQLPAPQLQEALTACEELYEPLKEHLLSLSDGQRVHVPTAVQEVLLGSYVPTSNIPLPEIIPSEIDAIVIQQSKNLNEPLPPGME